MLYDIRITAAQAKALGEWVCADIEEPADVELAVDDCMLVAEQGDDKAAWDTGGEPGSEEYVSLAPLDRAPTLVYVVHPYSSDEEPAVFATEEDAQAWAATFSSAGVFCLPVCAGTLAAAMVASRQDDEEPEEDEEPDYAPGHHPDDYRGPDGVLGNDFDQIDRDW